MNLELKRTNRKITLDPSQMGYRGLILAREIKEGFIGLFPESIQNFYSPFFIISHEGNNDFSLFFGRLESHQEEFIADLVVIFSFGELLKFLKMIKAITSTMEKEDKTKSENTEPNNQDAQIISKFMTITPNTIYFSPNAYFYIISLDCQIYFGRKMGKMENKDSSLFKYTVSLPTKVLPQIISAVELNIQNFEKKNKVNLHDLIIKGIEKTE